MVDGHVFGSIARARIVAIEMRESFLLIKVSGEIKNCTMTGVIPEILKGAVIWTEKG
jgi:hypothetical protein